MYYGAISTDIRKSSTNWNLFPEWMQKAVNYTNNITEFMIIMGNRMTNYPH